MKYILVEAVLGEGKIGFIGDRGEQPGIRRRNGDKFEVPENQFSERWMRKVEVPKKPGPKPKDTVKPNSYSYNKEIKGE